MTPASTRAFCVGQAKSGTASLAGLLRRDYRATHEPERAETLSLILQASRGELSRDAVRAALVERDRRLGLDYDIAWANQFLLDDLLVTFPGARFVVLVRDPYTWLPSVVGHLLSRRIPPEVRGFLDWWFTPADFPHGEHDAALEERGLYSTEAFLAAWNRHVDVCLAAIPEPRRLVIRTHELDRDYQKLADFLGIPLESLDTGSGHLNRSTFTGSFDTLVDPGHVHAVVQSTCGDNMRRLFPEVRDRNDVSTLWRT